MNESSSANIKQILTSIDKVIAIYENPEWVRKVTSEDIKVAFKLGNFVEKSVNNFDFRGCSSQFLKTVNTWGQSRQYSKYDKEFYSKVCDHLLMNFFKNKAVNERTIDIAVRMYTSLFPKERLEAVIQGLIMTSASEDAILSFILANDCCNRSLKYKLIVSDWCREYESGNEDAIVALIPDLLSSFKVENNLQNLLGILALNQKNPVTDLILNNILDKMLDRSILSKQFWLTLFKNVDKATIGEMCINYKDFRIAFCNFLIYIGSMMDKEPDSEDRWRSDANTSLCPEISYHELETITVFLCQYKNNAIKEYVLNRLSEAQDDTESSIWNQIKNKCL